MIIKNIDLICIDIDGVLRDITTPIKQVIYERYKLFPVTEKYYELHKWYPSITDKEEFYKYIFEYRARDVFLKYAKYYNEKDINRLKQLAENYNVILISKQKGRGIELTKAWLKKYLNGFFDDLPSFYVDNIEYEKKSDVINMLKEIIDYKKVVFIDDCIDNLNEVKNNIFKNSELISICVKRPWNLNWKGYTINSFYDIKSISENSIKINERK